MVEFTAPSPSASSRSSEDSTIVSTRMRPYDVREHEITYGLPDTITAAAYSNRHGVNETASLPPRPYRRVGAFAGSLLVQTPLPNPPLTDIAPRPASHAASTGPPSSHPPTPRPPRAFPPISPFSNKIAAVQAASDLEEFRHGGIGLSPGAAHLSSRKRHRPVGPPYKPGKRQVTVAPVGVPTSPQRPGFERSWVTWYHDGSTRNFIPALATEIFGTAEDMDWGLLLHLLKMTSHPHIIRLLDASHFPKRDPNTGDFLRSPNGAAGEFVKKSVTDLANLAGWDEQQWKRQREQWRGGRFFTDGNVMPGFFPHPFLVWERMDGRPLSMTLKKRPDGVEEGFIWYFLLSLLNAVQWLHHGIQQRMRTHEANWLPIVHNNINPDSIWLNRPWKNELRYGTLKLGDFSRAVTLDPMSTSPLNKAVSQVRFDSLSHKREPQQEDFEAPELSWLVNTDPKQNAQGSDPTSPTECHPIGGRSDVWSIGAVAVALMGGIWIDPDEASLLRWTSVSRERAFVLQTVQLYKLGGKRWDMTLLPSNYSLSLRTAIEKLLTLDPKRRPDAQEALALVRKQYDKWYADSSPSRVSVNPDDAIESGQDSSGGDDDDDDGDPFAGVRTGVKGQKRAHSSWPSGGTSGQPVGDNEADGDGSEYDSDQHGRPSKRRRRRQPSTPFLPNRPPASLPTVLAQAPNVATARGRRADASARLRDPNVGPRRDPTRSNFLGRPRDPRHVNDGVEASSRQAQPGTEALEGKSRESGAATGVDEHSDVRTILLPDPPTDAVSISQGNNGKSILRSSVDESGARKNVSFAPGTQHVSLSPDSNTFSAPSHNSATQLSPRQSENQRLSSANPRPTSVASYDNTFNAFGYMKRRSRGPEPLAGSRIPPGNGRSGTSSQDLTWKPTDDIRFTTSSDGRPLDWSARRRVGSSGAALHDQTWRQTDGIRFRPSSLVERPQAFASDADSSLIVPGGPGNDASLMKADDIERYSEGESLPGIDQQKRICMVM